MKNTRIRKRPKSKRNLRHAKKRTERSLKGIMKKSERPRTAPTDGEDRDLIGIVKLPSGMRSFDIRNSSFRGVHPEFFRLQEIEWLGMMTLKFHTYEFSKNDPTGEGRRNRLKLLIPVMDDLRRKLGIANREFLWVACEEFGMSGAGHLHALISLDYLKEKKRMHRLKISDFSEKGHFWRECCETVEFFSKEIGLNPRTVDFHWRVNWENEGLVGYFAKKEFGHEEKFFEMSDCLKKYAILNAA